MYSLDVSESDINFPASGSRLLSESPLPRSILSSHTGPGGDDLSISELSISDRQEPLQRPFNLLAQAELESSTRHEDDHVADNNTIRDDADNIDGEDPNVQKRLIKSREEKLQSDLFLLKKLNSSFALYNEALEEASYANERVAAQLAHTDGLLNKYIAILSKSEEFARLIFDEQWLGADVDEAVMERERIEAEEQARRREAELAASILRERQRREQEEQERILREEKDRVEKERSEKIAARGGIRGVRGTRASMRGSRGTTRTAPAAAVGRARSTSSSSTPQSGGIPSKQPLAPAPGRPTSTTSSMRSTSRRS